jgi:hypothetical protein
MNRFLVAVLGAALCVTVGCNKDKSADDAKMMADDVCTHCEGVQKATADGKCEACNMPVSAQRMSADACSMCPGVQTATADGKCPICEAKKTGASTRPAY